MSFLVASTACSDSSSPSGPTEPEPTAPWADVAVGDGHACVLSDEGQAYCWGDNSSGQAGVDGASPIDRPTAVQTELRFREIDAGGRFTCGLATDDRIYCWGSNTVSQLGNASGTDSSQPVKVMGDRSWSMVSVGTYHACGIDSAGALYCWGGDRWDSALGYRAITTCPSPLDEPRWPCSTPTEVGAGGTYASVAAGLYQTCAIRTDGITVCWGTNDTGQLGTETTATCAHPDLIHPSERACSRAPVSPEGTSLASVSPGTTHTCGISDSGQAHCWGALVLNFGQLGTDHLEGAPAPQAVSGAAGLVSVLTSHAPHIHTFTCGLAADGAASCWGANRFGQLGSVTTETCAISEVPCSAIPKPVSGGISFKALGLGSQFACGVDTDGTAWCWGINDNGQLGNGSRTASFEPVRVSDPG